MIALLLLAMAGAAFAQKDAAEKVQEGNVNNWIEYYRQQREAAALPPGAAAEEKRDERKETREERKDKGTLGAEQGREESDPQAQGERRD